MTSTALFDPDEWCTRSLPEQRELLAASLLQELDDGSGTLAATIEVGPVERPYDLTAALETDVGVLRTALWSNARATIFCDPSVHLENRRRFAPGHGLRAAAESLRRRLAVPVKLESRGLTLSLQLAEGVERTWSAEKSLFRGKTAVVREDRISDPGDADLRELLARHYTGPSLRLVLDDGSALLLPGGADEPDGTLISMCVRCNRWEEGVRELCTACGSPVDVAQASRPARR
jgi:hypothetical protein